MELTDEKWIKIDLVILQSMRKKDTCGRNPRDMLNGILLVLYAGVP